MVLNSGDRDDGDQSHVLSKTPYSDTRGRRSQNLKYDVRLFLCFRFALIIPYMLLFAHPTDPVHACLLLIAESMKNHEVVDTCNAPFSTLFLYSVIAK